MKADSPKLYGLKLDHMTGESRDEVAQDPDYAVWSKQYDPEKLWQAIMKVHKADCISNIGQVQELNTKIENSAILMAFGIQFTL
jgi:hypothetical protein